MFFIFIIQALVALTSVISSLFDTSLTIYTQSAFDLILDIPTVAFFLTPVTESPDANQTTIVSANDNTLDVCTFGILGLLSLRPIALPPALINATSRELQIYKAASLALSLVEKDNMTCAMFGNGSEETILLPSPAKFISTLPNKRRNTSFATFLRLYFAFGQYVLPLFAVVMLVGMRVRPAEDWNESMVSLSLCRQLHHGYLT